MQRRDPVCGMTVDVDRAPARAVYDGEPVAFCSVACQKAYEKSHPPSR